MSKMPALPGMRVHNGTPVPYVARWTSERFVGHIKGASFVEAVIPDQAMKTVYIFQIEGRKRDEFGWLWTPDDESIGEGEPEYGQVHPKRHRECMDKIICQVCGLPAGADAKWFVHPPLPDRPSKPIVTAHAPVCDDCVSLSNDRCPHLRKHNWPVVVAKRAEQYGVIGDIYDHRDGKITYQGHITAQHPQATQALARQRVVALRGWRQV